MLIVCYSVLAEFIGGALQPGNALAMNFFLSATGTGTKVFTLKGARGISTNTS